MATARLPFPFHPPNHCASFGCKLSEWTGARRVQGDAWEGSSGGHHALAAPTKSGRVRAKSLKPPCSRTKDLKTNLDSGQTEQIRRARNRGGCLCRTKWAD